MPIVQLLILLPCAAAAVGIGTVLGFGTLWMLRRRDRLQYARQRAQTAKTPNTQQYPPEESRTPS